MSENQKCLNFIRGGGGVSNFQKCLKFKNVPKVGGGGGGTEGSDVALQLVRVLIKI